MKTIQIIILIGIASNCLAQDPPNSEKSLQPTNQHGLDIYKHSSWFDLGFGWSGRGRAFSSSVNFQLAKRTLLSFSFDNVYYPIDELTNMFTLGLIPVEYKEGFDANSFSIKIGKVVRTQWGLITTSIGPSVVSTTQFKIENQYVLYSHLFFLPVYDPHYEQVAKQIHSKTAGLSIDLKIIPSTRIVGLVINPFINLNQIHNYGGLTICLAVGKMRVKNEN